MGNTTGTAVPQVSGPSYSGYTAPAPWSSPAVSGHDLLVHMHALRDVASKLDGLANQLQGSIAGWGQNAAQTQGAFGNWWAAGILASVVGRAHAGVGTFSNQLRQAHSDTARRLTMTADKYDAAEQHISTLINASNDPSSTIVESGGSNVATDPGYGQNWTPTQRANYERAMAMDKRMGGGSENWTGTYPVVEGTSFGANACYYYTWQEVQAMLEATNPDAITAAGQAYLDLSNQLTTVTGQLAGHASTLAQNWGGSTAVTAVSQIQQLHQTATDMQANTYSAGTALQWYGPVLAAFKSSVPQPTSTHAAATNDANKAANQHMDALNGHIQTAYYNMPGAVNKNLPPALAGTGGSGTAGGVGSGGGGGGNVPGMTGGSGSVPGVSPMPGTGGTNPSIPAPPTVGPLPSGPHPPGDTLTGIPPGTITPVGTGPGGPGGLNPPPPTITTPGGGGGGGLGVLPPIPTGGGGGGSGGITGTGTGGRGGGAPGEEDPIPGEPEPGFPGGDFPGGGGFPAGIGTIGGEPGPIGEVSGFGDPPTIGPTGMISGGQGGMTSEDLASGDAAMGEGMGGSGGVPMMGMGGMSGGAGEGGIGRGRASWTTEDEGTWGPDGAAPGADGAMAEDGMPGMMPFSSTSGQGQERNRSRQAWMFEEEDIWGTGQPTVPPVISQN
ncbi:MAG TPA: WXG100 family type VII secretion target [Streptosporangiaceae bacterium]